MGAGAAWYAIATGSISELLAASFTAAEVIQERCPLQHVRPEWVAGKDQADIFGR
jgi:hypothetical protein